MAEASDTALDQSVADQQTDCAKDIGFAQALQISWAGGWV
jgi:hypothetical protein